MLSSVINQNKMVLDVFDELEQIIYTYEDLINITTSNIMSEKQQNNEIKQENCLTSISNEIEENSNPIESNNENTSSYNASTSFVSIFDLLNDSYKSPFLPNHFDLLEQLKKYSLRKYGYNKKNHQMEEYSWRNSTDLLTYEQGGRLGELNHEKGGKSTNWHMPFYGYCSDDQILEMDNSRKESRRVACLLCDKLETLQLVRNTLVRHLKNHHLDIYTIYCSDDVYCSTQSLLECGSDISKIQSTFTYWETIMKLASFIIFEFLPFQMVCGETFLTFTHSLNPSFTPYNQRRLIDCILFSLYRPSLQFVNHLIIDQLILLPTSFVLVLDTCTIPQSTSNVYACSLSFIDHLWERRQYFIGFIPFVSTKVELSSTLNGIFSILGSDGGIHQSDCCACITNSTQLTTDFGEDLLQFNCCEYIYENLMKILAQAFLDCENHSDFSTHQIHHPPSSPHLDTLLQFVSKKSMSLISVLQKANSLINYLNSNQEMIGRVNSYNTSEIEFKHIFLESIDWNNLISVASSLSSLIQNYHAIDTYFNHLKSSTSSTSTSTTSTTPSPFSSSSSSYPPTSSSSSASKNPQSNLNSLYSTTETRINEIAPTESDWRIWSELITILEPIKTITTLLHGSNDCTLSLIWYMIDWLVCIYDQTIEWSVYSVTENKKISLTTQLLSPTIFHFRLKFTELLRQTFLTDLLKKSQFKYYELLCLCTYLDPRTKNFAFFRSIHHYPYMSDYLLLYQQDSKLFILNEMRNEICHYLEKFFLSGSSSSTTATTTTTTGGLAGGTDSNSGLNLVIERLILDSGIFQNRREETNNSIFNSSFQFPSDIFDRHETQNQNQHHNEELEEEEENIASTISSTYEYSSGMKRKSSSLNDGQSTSHKFNRSNSDEIFSTTSDPTHNEYDSQFQPQPQSHFHSQSQFRSQLHTHSHAHTHAHNQHHYSTDNCTTSPSNSSQSNFSNEFNSSHSLKIVTSHQLSQLRERIDEYCRSEMILYENEAILCPPHQIRQHNPLHYWSVNEHRYPVISRLARRYLSIQTVSIYHSKLQSITSRIYSKNRSQSFLCPGLFDAILFLHFNGILAYQIPSSLY